MVGGCRFVEPLPRFLGLNFSFDIRLAVSHTDSMPFSRLGFSPAILDGVKAMGYVYPTPIQLRAIPIIVAGQDVIGSAQTGTGKTAAFALPILSKLESHQPKPRLLVLEPTRELAAQVETAIRDFARFTNLRVAVVFGGVGYGKQNDALKNGVDITLMHLMIQYQYMAQTIMKYLVIKL